MSTLREQLERLVLDLHTATDIDATHSIFAAARLALEEAARECEEEAEVLKTGGEAEFSSGCASGARDCAAAIRNLAKGM